MNEQLRNDESGSVSHKLIYKALLFTLPFWIIIAIYLHDDPFMVLHKYKTYDSDVSLNEGHVGWFIYKNNRDSIQFNSFILGNSCTMAFLCHEWEKHLDNYDRAIRLFGNSESLKAILLKLQALEREEAEIKNALVILDKSSLSKVNLQSGFTYILPSEISGNSSFSTQSEFMQAFIMPDFLFPYLRYRVTGKVSSDMKYMNPYGKVRNLTNNDAINPRERMIEQEGESYWINRKNEFPKREKLEHVVERVIYQPQETLLKNIADLFDRHNTSLRIIISPDYNQKKLNPSDLDILNKIFGHECVFDFSGINEYTTDYHYYYEQGHYRPVLGNLLLDAIY